ncbi:hypothetical protein JTB14_032433 [Gonioctena quinquepunctata]|nr:hypothetical protein JTB14_032433 [Gonioctena quinquepunctata]
MQISDREMENVEGENDERMLQKNLPNVGDIVLAKKHSPLQTEIDRPGVTIKFLRKKHDAFVFPQADDVSTQQEYDMRILKKPHISSRGFHRFEEDLSELCISMCLPVYLFKH